MAVIQVLENSATSKAHGERTMLKGIQGTNTHADRKSLRINMEDWARIDESATKMAKTQIASALDSEITAGSRAIFVSEKPNDQSNPVIVKRMSHSVWRRSKRK